MKLTAKLSMAALVLGLAAPAMAQSMDVATATCADLVAADADSQGAILLWIDGYTGGVAGDTTLDLTRLEQNVTDAMAICAEDPTKSILEAMQAVSLEQ